MFFLFFSKYLFNNPLGEFPRCNWPSTTCSSGGVLRFRNVQQRPLQTAEFEQWVKCLPCHPRCFHQCLAKGLFQMERPALFIIEIFKRPTDISIWHNYDLQRYHHWYHHLIICRYSDIPWLVDGLEHEFYFSIYMGNNNPNWLIFFRGVETTNQITLLTMGFGWFQVVSNHGPSHCRTMLKHRLRTKSNIGWPKNCAALDWVPRGEIIQVLHWRKRCMRDS